MKKVLITGGAGFIGFHLAKDLARRGVSVDILDNFARGRRDGELENFLSGGSSRLIPGDLNDSRTVASIGLDYDAIFHFAAIVGVKHVQELPYEVLNNNASMVSTALSVARNQRSFKRFVFASTSEVYAGSLESGHLRIPTPETERLALGDLGRNRSTYMLSKIYGEALCHHSGVPFTILRPHNVYGPRMGRVHVIPELLYRTHVSPDGGILDVRSADHTRTFCYIDDAIELIRRCAESEAAAGRTLNIGSGSPEVSMRDLADVVVSTIGRKVTIRAKPAEDGSPPRRCPDMSLTNSLTGYPERVSLKEGVLRTYEWYRENQFMEAE